MKLMMSTELSEREIFLIGSIVAQWGFLEAEIFEQTLLSFEDESNIPKSMNNVQFSSVLDIWKERVVESKDDARKKVLHDQYHEIVGLNDYRQAIVHSRWEWRPDTPDQIVAVRLHKKTIKRVRFTVDDLIEFHDRLGVVRYKVRYPGGVLDQAAERTAAGGYISRKGWDMLSGRLSLTDSATVGDGNAC